MLRLCYYPQESAVDVLAGRKHVNDERLRELAILGLKAEQRRIDEELTALRGLEQPTKRRLGRPPGKAKQATGNVDEKAPRKRRKMSAAKKKALSDRMKRIWADRKSGNR